jgi:hypothetical protein
VTNQVVHFEIGGRDLGRMGSFYGELFGEPTEITGVGQFAMVADPGGNIIGLLHQQPEA